jgi:hypothetical protein
MKNKIKLLGLAVLLAAMASSCAVSMKMHGNRFESSEVYGKTAFRLKSAYEGQANVELTDDYTLTPPNTGTPNIGPTHNVVIGGGLGVKDRLEFSFDSTWGATAKFQILGAPKLTADEGNFSLSVLGTLGTNSTDQSGNNLFSAQNYKVHLEYTTYSAALLAGYRLDRIVNFYFGPFVEEGTYKGNYETVGVSNVAFDGKGRNKGGILGLEIGNPRVTGILEGVWNHTESASSRASYWLVGTQIVISFGSVETSAASNSRRD